jgi:hypothetical protein
VSWVSNVICRPAASLPAFWREACINSCPFPSILRDLTSDELAGRTTSTVDDIIDAYKSKHPARKPSQQEAQARDDDSATNAVLTAPLQSRDMSRRLTTNELLRIFASRTLDDLD